MKDEPQDVSGSNEMKLGASDPCRYFANLQKSSVKFNNDLNSLQGHEIEQNYRIWDVEGTGSASCPEAGFLYHFGFCY